jgi:phasin family protein
MTEREDIMTEVATQNAIQKALSVPSGLTENSVVQARSALHRAAQFIANAKRPTKVIGEAGLRVNQAAHDGVDKLVRHQVHMVEAMMDESAQRLQLASEAGSFKSLMNEQVAMLPETRARLVKDVRKTLEIVAETGTGVTSAVREEFAALRALAGAPAESAQAGEESPVVKVTEVSEPRSATTA